MKILQYRKSGFFNIGNQDSSSTEADHQALTVASDGVVQQLLDILRLFTVRVLRKVHLQTFIILNAKFLVLIQNSSFLLTLPSTCLMFLCRRSRRSRRVFLMRDSPSRYSRSNAERTTNQRVIYQSPACIYNLSAGFKQHTQAHTRSPRVRGMPTEQRDGDCLLLARLELLLPL